MNLLTKYISQLFEVAKTKTVRQSSVTFLGTFGSGILGVIFYIVLARQLGPSLFGILSVSIAAIELLSGVASVGTDTGILKFVGSNIKKNRNKALKFLKLGFKIKIIIWLGVLILGWFLVPYVSSFIFRKPELTFPLRVSLIGAGSVMLFSFSTYAIQAIQRFWVWSNLIVSTNFLRLIAILILMSLGLLSLSSTLFVYIAIPFLGFFAGLYFIPRFIGVTNERSVLGEFLKYNKWVALFILIAAISSRLDMFLSARFLSLNEVGIYSVAVSLASIAQQVVFALATVVASKMTSFDNNDKALNYIKKLQLFVIGLSILGVAIGIPLAHFIIPVFYGGEYLASINPFIILIISQAIFLISVPVHSSVFYYFSYPKLFVWVSLIHLLVVGLLGWYLIPEYGYMGAAVTVLVGNISNFLIPGIWVARKLK